jgi:hypothetical protein
MRVKIHNFFFQLKKRSSFIFRAHSDTPRHLQPLRQQKGPAVEKARLRVIFFCLISEVFRSEKNERTRRAWPCRAVAGGRIFAFAAVNAVIR